MAKKKEDENGAFGLFLKQDCDLETEEIDKLVFETTRRVWAGIDCTACANCCREVRPGFSEEEVDVLARRLGIERQQFIGKYLKRSDSDNNLWETRTTPCPFLKDNRCSVYEDRPAGCREYPYLYKPKFVSSTIGMVWRTFTCPIVYEVMENLKRTFGFDGKVKRFWTRVYRGQDPGDYPV
jgi:hypothetical protein